MPGAVAGAIVKLGATAITKKKAKKKWPYSQARGIAVSHYKNGREAPINEPGVAALHKLIVDAYGPPGSPTLQPVLPSKYTEAEIRMAYDMAPEPVGKSPIGEFLGSLTGQGGSLALNPAVNTGGTVGLGTARAGLGLANFFQRPLAFGLTIGQILGLLLVGGLVVFGIRSAGDPGNGRKKKSSVRRRKPASGNRSPRRSSAPKRKPAKKSGSGSRKGYPKTVTFKTGKNAGKRKTFKSAKEYMAFISKK